MIFVRVDIPSVEAAKTALEEFAACSGLYPNLEKTEIYFGGVGKQVRELILAQTDFVEGKFPFRYLGVPLNASRITIDMYNVLLTRIQSSTQHWSSHLLSYAGKIQLINTIVFGLESYWSASLLILKGLIKRITKLCKDFFWAGGGNTRMTFKSWSSICLPWDEGGFGVKEVLSWNKALIAKLLWNLDQGRGGIWTKWVASYYLNSCSIWEVSGMVSSSESFKAILAIRDQLLMCRGTKMAAQDALRACSAQGRFCTGLAYEMFRRRAVKINWATSLAAKAVIPCHSIITALAGQRKLATIDAICSRGMIIINRCALCKCHAESHRHLFFRCLYSTGIWNSLLAWIKLSCRSNDLLMELHWIRRKKSTKQWKAG
ncbi:hypothetical protein RND81_11G117000 [Saponaria officinalis]|uniref:Reverse transcriptase zinc-binding domain-containing protein n=1 Tax=Saponaria officinalis TaxID=3572 RepID=A0AAW1HJW8_SAPOF